MRKVTVLMSKILPQSDDFFIVILVLVLCIDLEYWCLTDVVFLIGPDILTIETKYLGVLLMICQVKNVLKRKLHAGLVRFMRCSSSGRVEEVTSAYLENIIHGKWNMCG